MRLFPPVAAFQDKRTHLMDARATSDELLWMALIVMLQCGSVGKWRCAFYLAVGTFDALLMYGREAQCAICGGSKSSPILAAKEMLREVVGAHKRG